MEIFKLFGSIFVDNAAANESISKTEEKAEGVGNKLLSGVGAAAKWGVAIAGAGVAAVGGMMAMANKTAEAADVIDKLSERTGINREELQRWKYAADQSGADITKLEVGVKKLSETMVMAGEGSKKSQDAFSKLGISMEQLKNSSPSEMFDTVMHKLAEMPDSAERNAIGNQMLGKSYTNMLPLLNAGADGMQELKDRADELGLVMSEDAVVANVVFGDTLADLKASFGAVFMHISNEFLPVLQRLIDIILLYMPQIQFVLQFVFGLIGTVAQSAIQAIDLLITAISSAFAQTDEGATGFTETLQMLWAYLEPYMQELKNLFETVLGAISQFWKDNGTEITAIVTTAWGVIRIAIETALNLIQSIIKIVTGLIKGDWQSVWDGIKQYVETVMNLIAQGLPALLELIFAVMRASVTIFLNLGQSMFNAVWDGMKSVWNSLSTWVTDKVNWLIEKLAFWRSSQAEMGGGSGGGSRVDGSHANGLSYVPFDGYVAELHQGERVLTRREAEEYKRGDNGEGITVIQNIYAKTDDERAQQKEAERRLRELLKKK